MSLPLCAPRAWRPVVALGAALILALASACTPPHRGAAGSAPHLLVLTAGENTLRWEQTATGRSPGRAVLVPPGSWQVVAGPGGSAAVLSLTPQERGAVTLAFPPGTGRPSRRVVLEKGAEASQAASDGRWLLVTYHSPRLGSSAGEGRGDVCRLALIDAARGAIAAAHTVCAPGEAVLSLAAGSGRRGEPGAYLGIWRESSARAAPLSGEPPRGRIVAVDPLTGAGRGAVPVDAIPAVLAVAPAGPGGAARLVCGCGTPDPAQLGRGDLWEAAAGWRALELDADALAVSAVSPLPGRPYAIAPTPDGTAAYVLLGGTAVGARASLLHLALGGGGTRALPPLPGRAAGVAVDADSVYVPDLDGQGVWVVDQRSGRLDRTIATGRRPVGVALAAGASAGSAAPDRPAG